MYGGNGGSLSAGDLDNDGDLDIFLNGWQDIDAPGARAGLFANNGGTLEFFTEVFPVGASIKSVDWMIIDPSQPATATIDNSGMVTAIRDGVVVVRAKAKDGGGSYADKQVFIVNQVTHIKNNKARQMMISPNPSENGFTLTIPEHIANSSLTIVDLKGVEIYTEQIEQKNMHLSQKYLKITGFIYL